MTMILADDPRRVPGRGYKPVLSVLVRRECRSWQSRALDAQNGKVEKGDGELVQPVHWLKDEDEDLDWGFCL